MAEEGYPVDHMLAFLENLLQNPSARAIEQLYNFLEKCNLPITPDGHFIAYKRIRSNWMDCHSGTISNRIGAVIEVSRQCVDDNPNRTCSYGLHVCSLEYLKHFHGERLILTKQNPRDVVAIPTDYNDTKMRVCRYEVLEELNMATIEGFDRDLPAVYGKCHQAPWWDNLGDDPDLDEPEYYTEDEDDGYPD